MKKVITTTHFRRPDYSAATTRALAEQPDAKEWHYIASIDRGPDAIEIMRRIMDYSDAFASAAFRIRQAPPSCNDNIRTALSRALESGADFTVMVEDDVLLGRDALATMMKLGDIHKDDPNVLTISAWRHPDGWLPESGTPIPEDESDSHGVNPWFTPWGWAAWSDRISEILRNWTTGSDTFPITRGRVMGSWDEHLNHVVRGNRVEAQPKISRAVNIGVEKGTHRGGNMLPYWINS